MTFTERYRNAPEAIKFWFKKAAKQLAGKHKTKASRSLGKLAHLLGDLANPMHTDQTSREDGIHSLIRGGRRQPQRQGGRDLSLLLRRPPPGQAGKKAKHVAAASHRSYRGLVRTYDRNGYSPYVHKITKRQLNRGANAVADVAAAIKAASKSLGNGGGGDGSGGPNCSPAYPDFCIPPPPPDRDCDDVNGANFTVKPPDPHGFDSDGDGVGCES